MLRVITMSVTEARADLAELINRVGYGRERVVITRHGKPLVALVAAADAAALWNEIGANDVTVLDLRSATEASSGSEAVAARYSSSPRLASEPPEP